MLLEGPGAGREWEADRPRLIMGRGEEVDLRFADDAGSRSTAFEAMDDAMRVRDLGSTNGVLVNERPVLWPTSRTATAFASVSCSSSSSPRLDPADPRCTSSKRRSTGSRREGPGADAEQA